LSDFVDEGFVPSIRRVHQRRGHDNPSLPGSSPAGSQSSLSQCPFGQPGPAWEVARTPK
jgi:hypothetical protein